MKARMSIKNIILTMVIIYLASMFFINICFAASTAKINVETARLREQPNTDSKILELISMDEEVDIVSEENGWYKVKYKKITGYVRKDLVQVENKLENIINDGKTTNNKTVETTSKVVSEKNNAGENVQKPENIENKNNTENTNNQVNNIQENTENTNNQVNEVTNNTENQNNKESTDTSTQQILKNEKYVVTENIKLKVIPLISSIELDELTKDIEVEVTEILNDWIKVKTSDEKTGWIRKEKVTTKKEEPKVSEASTKTSARTKKETSRGGTTTRSNQSASKAKNTQTQSVIITESATTSASGNEIVAYAKQFLGCKYIYGGTTTKGFDCSGFTQFVYRHFGISLNRTAAAQYSNGTPVNSLQAGDLVMFGKSGINHVAIYMGGNTIIHAANTNRGVTTDSLSSGYYRTNYVGARRIL